jgi:hypothetical protein
MNEVVSIAGVAVAVVAALIALGQLRASTDATRVANALNYLDTYFAGGIRLALHGSTFTPHSAIEKLLPTINMRQLDGSKDAIDALHVAGHYFVQAALLCDRKALDEGLFLSLLYPAVLHTNTALELYGTPWCESVIGDRRFAKLVAAAKALARAKDIECPARLTRDDWSFSHSCGRDR